MTSKSINCSSVWPWHSGLDRNRIYKIASSKVIDSANGCNSAHQAAHSSYPRKFVYGGL
jgi:hypothetical protein